MPTSYEDFVMQMVRSGVDIDNVDRLVLSEKSFDEFLMDDNLARQEEEKVEEELGDDWSVNVERGDTDHVVTDTGRTIELEDDE